MTECELCQKYGRLYDDDRMCAFIDGVFSSDNIDCVSMIYLRALCDDLSKTPHYFFNDDTFLGVVPYLSRKDGNGEYYYPAFIVLSWYKHRCNTGTAMWVSDNNEPRPIEESDVQTIIEFRKDDVAIVLDLKNELGG